MGSPIESGSCVLNVGESGSLLRLATPTYDAAPLSIVLQRYDEGPALDAGNVTADSPIVALVSFGATRAGDAFEVDVENGTVITVPWGTVEISARYERDPQPGATFPTQRVIATAYAGARPTSTRPKRRVRVGTLPTGVRTYVPVPKYAVDVTLLQFPGNLFLTTLAACRAPAGREIAEWTPNYPAGPQAVRLPSNTRSIQLLNAGDPRNTTLEFGLCL